MQVNYSHYEMLPSIKNENKNIQSGLLYHLTILLLGVSLEGMKSVCQGSSVFPMYFATLFPIIRNGVFSSANGQNVI